MLQKSLYLLRRSLYLVLLPAVCSFPFSAESRTEAAGQATVRSAYGQKIQLEGIGNAGKVNGSLYRGAQPHANSLAQLKALGITTVVDLRGEDSGTREREKGEAESLGMRFVSIPISGWLPPTNQQVAQFLLLFRAAPNAKIFVHCRFGEDRTGVLVATYRIAIEKWPAEQALREMYFFGFNGFWHRAMISFVRDFPARLASAPALADIRDQPAPADGQPN